MAYSTAVDVREALSPTQGGAPGQTAAGLSDEQINDAIAEADSIIDGFVGGSYVTTPVPPIVHFWSRDIGAYLATLTWRKSNDITDDDPVVRRYQLALLQLQGIAKGTVTVPLPDPPAVVTGNAYVANQYEGNLFNAAQFDMFGGSPLFNPPFNGGRNGR